MAAGRTEFELKFTASPEAGAGLPSSRFFAAVAPSGGAWERLTSTYFDTADGVLAASGLSLRLREEGASLIQAVKVRGESPAARTEYETEIATARDFPVRTSPREVHAAIASAGELVEIAGTVVDRWSTIIEFRGAQIELAVDLGRAERRDGDGRVLSAPLAEAELELIAGERKAVFDFARLMLDNAPLRLAAGTKLDAALGLGRSAIPKYRMAPLQSSASAGELLNASLTATASRLTGLHGAVVDLRRPEGVHQMRVALRRFRAVERIFRRHLGNDEIRSLAMRAKGIAAALAPARDWDVFIGETLAVVSGDPSAPPGLRQLKAAAEAERARAWAEAVEILSDPAFTHFTLDLLEAGTLAIWRAGAAETLKKPLAAFAPKALDRALRKTMKMAAQIRSNGPSAADDLAALHPLRIALKKLRYPLQTFKCLYPKAARKDYMQALSALQASLGVVNDAVVAQGLADRASEGGGVEVMRAAGFISGYKAAQARYAAQEIDAAWDAFEKMTPFWKLD